MNQKCVLITGASRGIGRACAIRFARAGFHVFINCKTSIEQLEQLKSELDSLHTSCTIVPGDAGCSEDVRAIFQIINRSAGGLDVLVNNAGISYIGLLTDMTDQDWDSILSANLSSAFYCCRAAIPHMISQKQGKILNISSMWGRNGASCEAAYSATKAGLNGLTMALAKELAPSNIQVNAIACGVIDTSMNAQFSEEERAALMDEIPAGRFGTPEEVADLVFDLAKSHSYMTGQIIGLDGGFL